ncbi:FabD/lysophospholipase-like protein [Daldinia bambusicola]|nr:FabD/lysophospholipase-like protein [Daldinia bambusicola]
MPTEIEPVGNTHSTTIEPSRPFRRYQDVVDEAPGSPWAKKTVLTFDGGGVRGYSSLLVLKSLMLKIKEIETEDTDGGICSSSDYSWMGTYPSKESASNESTLNDFLPCHYFDYIAGTSTGGLSAIMLGRLRMTVDEALEQYESFGKSVFGKARRWHERSIIAFPRAKYSSKKVMSAFQNIIQKSMGKDGHTLLPYEAEMELFQYNENRTRTMVFSLSIDNHEGIAMVYLWRSYDHEHDKNAPNNTYEPLNPSPAHTVPIWQIARATSAAPTYFEPIKIGTKEHFDGGLVANNPATHVLNEVRQLHGYSPKLFISIGCGLKNRGNGSRPTGGPELQTYNDHVVDSNKRKMRGVKKWPHLVLGFTRFMTDTEGQHGVQGWNNECIKLQIEHRWRLNVEGDLSTIALDDWDPPSSGSSTLDKIRQETDDYLSQDIIKEKIAVMARELVKIRRERAETELWESFALDVAYHCPKSSCQPRRGYKTRDEFRKHVMFSCEHDDMNEGDLEEYLNRCRKILTKAKRDERF